MESATSSCKAFPFFVVTGQGEDRVMYAQIDAHPACRVRSFGRPDVAGLPQLSVRELDYIKRIRLGVTSRYVMPESFTRNRYQTFLLIFS